jgi:hypothetical protein
MRHEAWRNLGRDAGVYIRRVYPLNIIYIFILLLVFSTACALTKSLGNSFYGCYASSVVDHMLWSMKDTF